MRERRPPGDGGAPAATDWGELRRRVEAAGARLAVTEISPEQARAILDERAAALAATEHAELRSPIAVLLFELAGETYAIRPEHLSGVFPLQCLTPIPGAHPSVMGISEWRGELVTVVDLRRLLDLPTADLDNLTTAIVLADGTRRFAVLADVVHGLSVIEEPGTDASGAPAPREHVVAVTPEAVVLLDAQSLLSVALTRST